MPSPFPGMDPYLEGSLWMSVHATAGLGVRPAVEPSAPPALHRLVDPAVCDGNARGIRGRHRGDLSRCRRGQIGAAEGAAGWPGRSPLPFRWRRLMRTPVPHITVEIRDIANRQLVAVIEVLSPTNKRGEGYDEYVDKRDRILRSSAHLIEIDLLRKGQRVPMQGTLPSVPYFVFLCRAEQRPMTEVWPIPLDQPLPEAPVPLLPGDADAKLDLQQALTIVYDECGLQLYDRLSEASRGSTLARTSRLGRRASPRRGAASLMSPAARSGSNQPSLSGKV